MFNWMLLLGPPGMAKAVLVLEVHRKRVQRYSEMHRLQSPGFGSDDEMLGLQIILLVLPSFFQLPPATVDTTS